MSKFSVAATFLYFLFLTFLPVLNLEIILLSFDGQISFSSLRIKKRHTGGNSVVSMAGWSGYCQSIFAWMIFLLLNVFWTERPFFARKLGFWFFKGNDSIPHSLSSKNFQFRNCIFKINKSSLWLFLYSLLFCITLENSGGLIGSLYPGITVTKAHFLCCSLHQLLGFSWFLCAKRFRTWFYSELSLKQGVGNTNATPEGKSHFGFFGDALSCS